VSGVKRRVVREWPLVGIGFVTTVIAAVAERFVASSRSPPPTSTNEDLLRHLRLLNRRPDALESHIAPHLRDDDRRAA
jgi:hypothetical protein